MGRQHNCNSTDCKEPKDSRTQSEKGSYQRLCSGKRLQKKASCLAYDVSLPLKIKSWESAQWMDFLLDLSPKMDQTKYI